MHSTLPAAVGALPVSSRAEAVTVLDHTQQYVEAWKKQREGCVVAG